jgi:hypothetical protein
MPPSGLEGLKIGSLRQSRNILRRWSSSERRRLHWEFEDVPWGGRKDITKNDRLDSSTLTLVLEKCGTDGSQAQQRTRHEAFCGDDSVGRLLRLEGLALRATRSFG